MNDKERQKEAICEILKQKRVNLKQAAEQCDIRYDQMLRVYKKYISEGDAGLIFGPRGRVSNRKLKRSPRNYQMHRESFISVPAAHTFLNCFNKNLKNYFILRN